MLGYPKVLVSWQLFRVPPPGELRVPTGVIANDSIGVRMLNEVQLPEQLKARRLQGHFSCDSELMNARVQQVLATSRRSIVGHDNHVADSRPRVALRVRDDVQQFANCRVVLMQGDPASKSRGITPTATWHQRAGTREALPSARAGLGHAAVQVRAHQPLPLLFSNPFAPACNVASRLLSVFDFSAVSVRCAGEKPCRCFLLADALQLARPQSLQMASRRDTCRVTGRGWRIGIPSLFFPMLVGSRLNCSVFFHICCMSGDESPQRI